tara:strand:+ start:1151 stop:1729 length:579 start_codon:yes stop_codon:yes gene_type:complete
MKSIFSKRKTFPLSFKILNFLFLSPILISLPFLINIHEAKAGLEFQWNQDSGHRRLKWFQKENKRRLRNTIYFFLRPSDRTADLLKVNLAIPETFKSTLKKENIKLCKVKIGGFESRTKCLEDIPADIEIAKDSSSIDFYPYRPIPSNKDSFAVVFKVFNPRKTGLFQFHSYGQPAGKTISTYLGSWTIVID